VCRFAFADYCAVNLTTYFNTPKIGPLAALIDPLGYKANLTMPKLVVDACGDEFFQLDDDAFWWGDLPGETYRAMIPDAEHSLATGIPYFFESATGFWQSIINNAKRPQITWTIDETTGVIDAWTDTAPTSVQLWFATTYQDQRRDFRLVVDSVNGTGVCPVGIPVDLFGNTCVVPVLWVSEEIAPYKNDTSGYYYTFSQPLPPTGWRGFLGDFTYPGPTSDLVYRFTTQASTIPNTRPFGPCPTGCPCQLV
jgi:PhoPQ-activated pathogenicity-related protein